MSSRIVLTHLGVGLLLSIAAHAVEPPAERARNLVALLQSDAPFFDKARACQQLGEVGDASAVPALAALLGDEHLAAYARSGLEGIPGPAPAEALRHAVTNLQGAQRAGVIDSLGVLRDENAVDLLIQLSATSPGNGAPAAQRALGRIASEAAVTHLLGVLRSATSETARADAATGCLLAAEHLCAAGRTDAALPLYDVLRRTTLPNSYRMAATRGAIEIRGSRDLSLLTESLRSNDLALRAAALQAIRFLSGPEVARVLNAEAEAATPERKALLIAALADAHDQHSLQLLRACIRGDDAEARTAALHVIGRIGGADAVDILLAAANGADKAASDIAMDSLLRLEGEGVDARLATILETVEEAPAFHCLAKLAEARRIFPATPALLKRAADPDEKIASTALRVLKTLASPENLPDLIAIIRGANRSATRDAAGSAYVAICERTDTAQAGSELLQKTLVGVTNIATRCSELAMLAALGRSESLPTLEKALNDADETVAACTARELARWQNPAPVEMLLARAAASGPESVRRLARASAIALTTHAAEAGQRPPEKLLEWLARCIQVAPSPSDRLLVISGLAHVKHAESMRLLLPSLDDAVTRDAAALAIARIAPALSSVDPVFLRASVERAIAFVSDPATRDAAMKFIASLPVSSPGVLLFDGQTLNGWAGDTRTWRVRDGAIVGGDLNGNTQNEFLATTRSYTNFVLRLEYRLVGTQGFINGGIQLHSVRIPKPPNEMSGYQADIGAGYSGALYDESRRNKVLARPPAALIKRLETPGDWNRYEIRCSEGRIEIFLNGERTVDYLEPDAQIPQHGLIALQIHGGSKSEIAFRHLNITELPGR